MLKKYLLNTSGNFGIMFALFSTVLVLGVGVAVDFAGLTSQRQKLQNYIDAAVLAAVTSDTKDVEELQKIVDEHIALLNVDGWDISAPVRFDGDDLVIDAATEYDTIMMGAAMKIMGGDSDGKMDVGASTAAPTGSDGMLNIALVLDTTNSMSGANIDGLKAASDELLDGLQAFGDNVRVSIVPFGQYVNIESQRGQPWLDLSKEDEMENFVNIPREERNIITPSVCTPTGNIISGGPIYQDGVIIGQNPDYEEQSCTERVLGEPTIVLKNYQLNHRWNGCAGSRDIGDNTKAAYDGVKIPGAMEAYYTGDFTHTQRNASCGDEMMPLSNDFAQMKSLISGLTTSGDTYLPSGLMWGWRALTPSAPLTEAASSPEDTQTVMIFMTDGFNTLSQNGVHHDGWERQNGLELSREICENIRKDKIDVYTVAYNMPTIDDAKETRDLLKKCASTGSKSYEAKDAEQLKSTFKNIVDSLGTVRLKYRPS